MRWRCGDEVADGLSVLAIARPGLQLDSTILPRVIFHIWLAGIGERLLRGYAGMQPVREHELSLLTQGVAVVGASVGPARDEEERLVFFGALASLGHLPLVHNDRPELMGNIASWVVAAAEWATKHHTRDRRCPHDPPVLAAEAVALWVALAEVQGVEPSEARRIERELQLSGLIEATKEHLDEDFRAPL